MKAETGRVLVTGAAGFLGSALVRALAQRGAAVHALVRPASDLWRLGEVQDGLTVHRVDVTDRRALIEAVAALRPEIIFHLAAQGVSHGRRNHWGIVAANIAGAAHLLEATEGLEYRRLVHVGGASEYGCKDGPIREEDPPQPVTLYGATKTAATALMQYAARAAAKPVVVVRPFSVYGPREPAGRLIPTAVLAALRKGEIYLTGPGIRRDFVYVEDVAEALVLAAERESATGCVINIGSGVEFANEEVVAKVLAAVGARVPVHAGTLEARPWDCAHSVADIERARQRLGWTPRHSLDAGLEKTVAWFREQGNRYP